MERMKERQAYTILFFGLIENNYVCHLSKMPSIEYLQNMF